MKTFLLIIVYLMLFADSYAQPIDFELIKFEDCDTGKVYSPYSNIYIKKITLKEGSAYLFEFYKLSFDSLIFIDSFSFNNLTPVFIGLK